MLETFWSLKTDEVLQKLNTKTSGLSSSEASSRYSTHGPNKIPDSKSLSKLSLFLNQLKSPLIFILIIASLVTLALREIGDTIFILTAVIINSFLGFYQENKAENALKELKHYFKRKTVVIRDNKEFILESKELVPGDIISLLPGNRVPADARIIKSNNLIVDEAILTGESLPVNKNSKPVSTDTDLADRTSMVWSGTLIVNGTASAVVTNTGAESEIGRIASMVRDNKDDDTPLQAAIKEFTVKLSVVLVALTSLLFGLGIYLGQDIFDMFLTSVAVAVSAIPEGLPIALTVILATGVQRMAKKKGVVRKLLAAETLGSTTIVLTDKTGTLTEAKSSLSKVVPLDKVNELKLIQYAALSVNVIDSGNQGLSGRPLEISIIKALKKYKTSLSKIKESISIQKRIPFNSKDKFSSVVINNNSKTETIFLGAPDILLNLSKTNPSDKKKILSQIDELAYSGEKLVGVSVKTKSTIVFLGLLSFRDPVRPNVKLAISKAKRLGVSTVIVTGDHQGTAEAVGKQIGLFKKGSTLITGKELSKMSDDAIKKSYKDISIFARVTPEQKLRIAKIYKEIGEVVAMTGDGINDAPALKEASIGIAVGSGTEVAKGAADLIILDDNFETIVSAIEEGRRTVDKIRKVIVYLLSDIVDELILIGGSLIMGLAIPINALQILWVNFFSDSFPAIGLAFEEDLSEASKKPSRIKNNLLDKEMKFLIMVIGGISSILLFTLYYVLLKLNFDPILVRTFIFASFGFYSLMLVFSMRSLKKSIIQYKNIFSNEFLTAGVGIGIVLMTLAIYFPPLQNVLDTVPLSPIWIVGVILVGFVNIIGVEFGKWLYYKK